MRDVHANFPRMAARPDIKDFLSEIDLDLINYASNSDYVYTRGDFSGFVNVFGFINFRVFGFVGVYTRRIFGFLTRLLRKHS